MQQQATKTLLFTFMGWGRYNYDPHFTDEETETRRLGKVNRLTQGHTGNEQQSQIR